MFLEDGRKTEENFYWRLENQLKEWESRLDSCLGVNGGIFAARKSALFEFSDNTVVEDFVIGMRVRERDYRVKYIGDAVGYEESPSAVSHEFKRRVRIGAGDYQALSLCWKCLLPRYGWFAFCFWSHKLFRWLTPFCLALIFVLSARQKGVP